jgi:hypothetical protein
MALKRGANPAACLGGLLAVGATACYGGPAIQRAANEATTLHG